MIDYKREMKYREDHEVSIFTISEEDIEQINATDHGIEVTERFRVMGFDIEVKNELLCEAGIAFLESGAGDYKISIPLRFELVE